MRRFQRFPDYLSPEDRRVYWRWVGGLLAVYATILAVTIGTVVGNNWSPSPAQQSAAAKPAGENLQTATAATTPARRATKFD